MSGEEISPRSRRKNEDREAPSRQQQWSIITRLEQEIARLQTKFEELKETLAIRNAEKEQLSMGQDEARERIISLENELVQRRKEKEDLLAQLDACESTIAKQAEQISALRLHGIRALTSKTSKCLQTDSTLLAEHVIAEANAGPRRLTGTPESHDTSNGPSGGCKFRFDLEQWYGQTKIRAKAQELEKQKREEEKGVEQQKEKKQETSESDKKKQETSESDKDVEPDSPFSPFLRSMMQSKAEKKAKRRRANLCSTSIVTQDLPSVDSLAGQSVTWSYNPSSHASLINQQSETREFHRKQRPHVSSQAYGL